MLAGMRADELAACLSRPEIHRRIVGDYKGAYALGVTSSPDHKDKPALLLRVEGEAPPDVPQTVTIKGEPVQVIVKSGFAKPKAL
jgi:hypothetical protein